MNRVQISVATRLHCGLIDLGFATRRIFGGFGIGLEEPRSELSWISGEGNGIAVESRVALETRTKATITRALERLVGQSRSICGRVIVERVAPQHVGLGVTTSLVLGALHVVNMSENLGRDTEDIKSLSGRGGTSGVGLSTFFQGGLVVDAGRPRVDNVEFVPSGVGDARTQATHVMAIPFPVDWSALLLLPRGRRWHGADEVGFFRKQTPIPNSEILEVMGIVYHSVVPSILEEDIIELQCGLHALNRVGFKSREVVSQGQPVSALLDRLAAARVPAGMSSMGPLVYAIGPDNVLEDVAREVTTGPDIVDLGVVGIRGVNTAAVK